MKIGFPVLMRDREIISETRAKRFYDKLDESLLNGFKNITGKACLNEVDNKL